MKCDLLITLKKEYVVFENQVLKKDGVRNLGLTHIEQLCQISNVIILLGGMKELLTIGYSEDGGDKGLCSMAAGFGSTG